MTSQAAQAQGTPPIVPALAEMVERARAHPGAVPRGARAEAEALGLARCRELLRGISDSEREEMDGLRHRVAALQAELADARALHQRDVARLEAAHAAEMEAVLRQARRERYLRGTRVIGIEVA